MRAVYLECQAAVAAFDLPGFYRVSAFWASLGSDWIDFAAEGAYVVICGYEFSAVFAGMFISWHL
jgi:hypothetical protein